MCLAWPIICADHSPLIKCHRRLLLLCRLPLCTLTSASFYFLPPPLALSVPICYCCSLVLLRHPLFTCLFFCRSPRSSYLPHWIFYLIWLKPLLAIHPTHPNSCPRILCGSFRSKSMPCPITSPSMGRCTVASAELHAIASVPNENATSLYVAISKCAGGRFESTRWRITKRA